jgi:hypothetical protein
MMRRALQLIVSACALAALIALSSWQFGQTVSDRALLRLSWRAIGRELEQCRALSAEEIARQPAHMRQTQKCERVVEPYRLEVLIDDSLRADTTYRPTGARGDRPLYVLRDFPVTAGMHDVEVRFYEVEAAAHVSPEQRGHFPDAVVFSSTIEFAPRRIALVTYDADRRTLVLRASDR